MPAIYAVVATLWLLTVAYAQFRCSLIPSIGHHCNDPTLDVWLLPFITAPIGGFAVLGLILMALVHLFRR